MARLSTITAGRGERRVPKIIETKKQLFFADGDRLCLALLVGLTNKQAQPPRVGVRQAALHAEEKKEKAFRLGP